METWQCLLPLASSNREVYPMPPSPRERPRPLAVLETGCLLVNQVGQILTMSGVVSTVTLSMGDSNARLSGQSMPGFVPLFKYWQLTV